MEVRVVENRIAYKFALFKAGRNHGRRGGMDDTEDDDTISTGSTATSSEFTIVQDVEEEGDDTSKINEFIDYLYEKRSLFFFVPGIDPLYALVLKSLWIAGQKHGKKGSKGS